MVRAQPHAIGLRVRNMTAHWQRSVLAVFLHMQGEKAHFSHLRTPGFVGEAVTARESTTDPDVLRMPLKRVARGQLQKARECDQLLLFTCAGAVSDASGPAGGH